VIIDGGFEVELLKFIFVFLSSLFSLLLLSIIIAIMIIIEVISNCEIEEYKIR